MAIKIKQAPKDQAHDTELEEHLCKRLHDSSLADLYQRYIGVKQSFSKSSPFINSKNPGYTDHSIGHSLDVQRVIYSMIRESLDDIS